MREPIGYIPLCEHLLNQGVMTDVIIKHRWAMQAIAKYSVKLPSDTDFDQKEVHMQFVEHGRGIAFTFDRMSGRSKTTLGHEVDGYMRYDVDGTRATEGNIEFAFAWLQTATAQWVWYLRFWVWVKEQFV